jgi:hypothetical protein
VTERLFICKISLVLCMVNEVRFDTVFAYNLECVWSWVLMHGANKKQEKTRKKLTFIIKFCVQLNCTQTQFQPQDNVEN